MHLFCSCFFLVPISFSFYFVLQFFPISSCWHSNMQYCPVNICTATCNTMQFIWPMFATTCNVSHDRWPHRFILNDTRFILVTLIPWHLFSFQITRDVCFIWHNDSCSFSFARFSFIHPHSHSFTKRSCKTFPIFSYWHHCCL